MTIEAFARIKITSFLKGTDCVRPMASSCGMRILSMAANGPATRCSFAKVVRFLCSKPRSRASVSTQARRKAELIPMCSTCRSSSCRTAASVTNVRTLISAMRPFSARTISPAGRPLAISGAIRSRSGSTAGLRRRWPPDCPGAVQLSDRLGFAIEVRSKRPRPVIANPRTCLVS